MIRHIMIIVLLLNVSSIFILMQLQNNKVILPSDILIHILSYIPYCRYQFNNYPALVSKFWLLCFRKSNTKCKIYHIFRQHKNYKYCYTHKPIMLQYLLKKQYIKI
jgi:hypothetical protein